MLRITPANLLSRRFFLYMNEGFEQLPIIHASTAPENEFFNFFQNFFEFFSLGFEPRTPRRLTTP